MDDGQPSSDITPAQTNAMLGPIVMGDMMAILLYGVLLSTFHRFLSSSSWHAASRSLRATSCFVMAATTTVTGLYARDLYMNSTTVVKTLQSVAGGDIPEAVQIPLLGVISATVQVVLVLRASRIVNEPRWRWFYIVSLGALILLETLACAISAVYEIRYTFVQDDDYYCVISWPAAVMTWQGSAALIDILISTTYIYQLCRRLRGVTQTVGAESVLRIIVRMVVQSAAFTATFASLAAINTAAFLDWNLMTEDIYYCFFLPLPSLYALSLFTTLSIREKVTKTLGNQTGQAFTAPHSRPRSPRNVPGVQVSIEREMLSERFTDTMLDREERRVLGSREEKQLW